MGAGLVGFGIGAILGSMMGPPEVYFVPPPPRYYGPVVYGPPNYDGPVAYGPPDSYRPRTYRPRKLLPASELWTAATGARSRWQSRLSRSQGAACRRPRAAPCARAFSDGKDGPRRGPPVKQDPNAKFKAVQAKAKRVGVEQLTQKDIEGLSFEQIKQLRGY